VTFELFDHVVLGFVAGLVCAALSYHAAPRRPGERAIENPPELRLALWLVAAITALSTLLVLLGENGTQDGMFAGDVRLRNLFGAVAFALTWAVALWARRVRLPR
jgi:uncharacterized membrane protein (DUF4010 family)